MNKGSHRYRKDGTRYHHSAETIKRIADAQRGVKRKSHSVETKIAMSLNSKSELNPFWKGEKASYRSKHIWVEYRLGKPHYCEECKRTDLPHRNYHWANISKEYKRDIKDWRRLCAKCHAHYDGNRGRKTILAKKLTTCAQ